VPTPKLKVGSRLGKYRLRARLGEGGFSVVYRAYDTLLGLEVALKVPHGSHGQAMDKPAIEELRREVRLTARLEHPNILPIRNAAVIDGVFVIAYPLGTESLCDRLVRRVAPATALSFAEQAIRAISYAHAHRIIHCDIKPDNFILFPGNQLRLADFGIAKVAMRRMTLASGQGTVGYIAPEQALGKPSLRSDVFSLGLLIYRLFSGELPEWPYEWPPEGIARARRALHPDMLALVERCLEVDERRRFETGVTLEASFDRVKPHALASNGKKKKKRRRTVSSGSAWRSIRFREFERAHGKQLETRAECGGCQGPVSESMQHCPWCGVELAPYQGPRRFPARCKRCGRSAKRDWRYCAYCYGPAIQEPSARSYPDRRYTHRCGDCRTPLMPFMRYCPGCRKRITRSWRIEGERGSCPRCRSGVVKDFWEHCASCGLGLRHK
jgi:serine/threonine-protein kinase